ncbi:MAG: ThiF family adenylyltransferase [Saccharofermentanales bacterium]|jgi:molybdopterin/thiamine biosynthesis adenylyltransferase
MANHYIWQEPVLFDLSKPNDAKRLNRLKSETKVFCYDAFFQIANNLFELEYPQHIKNDNKRNEYITNLSRERDTFGIWIFFPWSHELVLFPDKETYYKLRTFRYLNLIKQNDLQILSQAKIAVIGMSVGSNVTLALVRNSIGKSFAISDLVIPNVSNIGRASFDMRDLNSTKLNAIAKQISYLDPFVEQVHFPEGINEETVDKLAAFQPDIVIDEIDSMRKSVLLRKLCKEKGIAYVSASDVHDSVIIEVLRHDRNKRLGLLASTVSDAKADKLYRGMLTEDEESLYFAQSVGFLNLSPELIQSGLEIGKTLSGIPQLGSTAICASGIVAAVCREILLGRKLPSGLYSYPLLKSPSKFHPARLSKLLKAIIKIR